MRQLRSDETDYDFGELETSPWEIFGVPVMIAAFAALFAWWLS